MAYEEKTRATQKPHNIIIEDRCRLTISGVEDVESFDESEIAMYTAKGSLVIRGTGLHIGKLSLDTGEMSVEGLFNDLGYEEPAPTGGFWQRLFS